VGTYLRLGSFPEERRFINYTTPGAGNLASADMITKGLDRTSNTGQACAELRVVSVVEVLPYLLNLRTVSDTDL